MSSLFLDTINFDLELLKCQYFEGFNLDRTIKMGKRTVYDYEIEYYTKSDGGIEIDGKFVSFEAGSINFRVPGQVVRGVAGYNCYILCFDILGNKDKREGYNAFGSHENRQPKYNNSILNNIPNKIPADKCTNAQKLIKSIYNKNMIGSDIAYLEIKADLYALFCELYKATQVGGSNILIKKALRYIGENYNNQINILEIADFVGVSVNYFHNIFKATMGITPNNYILKLRLERAKYLLSATDMMVCDIGEQCGFLDNVYFSYVFKKKEGVTPKEYRLK